MTVLRTERLILRNWQDRDRPFFHRLNSDDTIMEFFAMRRDRAASDEVMDTISAYIAENGFGFMAAELVATGECIGFIGINRTKIEPFVPRGTLEIGWRLAPEYWGKGYATEGAKALLDYAFETLGEEEVVSFAVWNNVRSTSVMERLGMEHVEDGFFDHPSVPDSHPQLKRHALYRLTRTTWLARRQKDA
ncbi:GNAT family N-acetyltransferase [Corticibacterium sp. UT-5YL-CI-8]|nr:GNAT family N-acetyltransferase [Tianweitania sp. UT-5YL-CI-8]